MKGKKSIHVTGIYYCICCNDLVTHGISQKRNVLKPARPSVIYQVGPLFLSILLIWAIHWALAMPVYVQTVSGITTENKNNYWQCQLVFMQSTIPVWIHWSSGLGWRNGIWQIVTSGYSWWLFLSDRGTLVCIVTWK